MNQVNDNLIVKTDQCKMVDVRETGDILVSRPVRVPRTDDITIADVRVKFAPTTEATHGNGPSSWQNP